MLTLFILANLAVPAFESNSALRAECAGRTAICAGYIQGASDMLAAMNGMKGVDAHYCPRRFSNPEEMRAAYVAWVDAHPEDAEYSAASTLMAVLRIQFPCNISN